VRHSLIVRGNRIYEYAEGLIDGRVIVAAGIIDGCAGIDVGPTVEEQSGRLPDS
jgi:hypothetical protein